MYLQQYASTVPYSLPSIYVHVVGFDIQLCSHARFHPVIEHLESTLPCRTLTHMMQISIHDAFFIISLLRLNSRTYVVMLDTFSCDMIVDAIQAQLC